MRIQLDNPTLLNAKQQLQDAAARLQAWDERRDSVPGEHWVALGAGLWVFMATRRSRSLLMQLGGAALASILVVRAASGRDGLAQKRWLPL